MWGAGEKDTKCSFCNAQAKGVVKLKVFEDRPEEREERMRKV